MPPRSDGCANAARPSGADASLPAGATAPHSWWLPGHGARRLDAEFIGRRIHQSVNCTAGLRPNPMEGDGPMSLPVSYTHLRAHETRHDLVCRLLLEKKKQKNQNNPFQLTQTDNLNTKHNNPPST